jgi:hypothetical protein
VTPWLAAFALTQAVEIPVVWRALPERGRWARLAIAAGGSALTHPIVWFVAPRVIPAGWTVRVAVAETFAVLVEAVWLRAFGVRRAFWWSLLANASSLATGLLVRAAFGWP